MDVAGFRETEGALLPSTVYELSSLTAVLLIIQSVPAVDTMSRAQAPSRDE
jgi:hypothetical protein